MEIPQILSVVVGGYIVDMHLITFLQLQQRKNVIELSQINLNSFQTSIQILKYQNNNI